MPCGVLGDGEANEFCGRLAPGPGERLHSAVLRRLEVDRGLHLVAHEKKISAIPYMAPATPGRPEGDVTAGDAPRLRRSRGGGMGEAGDSEGRGGYDRAWHRSRQAGILAGVRNSADGAVRPSDGADELTADELRARVADLSVWRRGSERAPNKPLLLLWALGRLNRGEARLAPYTTVDAELKPILEEFGPPRKSYHTEYPFWYLRNDGLWEVIGVEGARLREGKASEPTKGELVRLAAEGGLIAGAHALLTSDPALVREVATTLLQVHFTESYHDDLLEAVGLDLEETVTRRRRDPRFREHVLVAYGYRCAVCGFDARLRHAPVGLEAAHIQWHQARGPDIVPNGLALCALHHKLFDRGGFTVGEAGRIMVSRWVNGGEATSRWLVDVDDAELGVPRLVRDAPDEKFLSWHREAVFRE